MENAKTVKPKKLRDGSWGITSDTPVAVNEIVTIVTSSGKSWKAKVSEIIFKKQENDKVFIIAKTVKPSETVAKKTYRKKYNRPRNRMDYVVTGYCKMCGDTAEGYKTRHGHMCKRCHEIQYT